MPRKRRQPPNPDCANEEHTRKYVNKVDEYTAERIQSTSKSLGVSEMLLADNDNRLSCSQTSNNLHRDPLHTSTAIKQRGKRKEAQPDVIQGHTGNFTSNHKLVNTSEMHNDQPQNSHHSDVMEGKTVTGRNIRLEVIHHDSNSCCEFVVSSPKFSFPKWLCLTALFNAMGFLFNLHSQDQYLMSVVLALLLVILLLKIHFKVKKESLLVMSSIGVQLTTTFASGRTSSHFIGLHGIKDVIINEAVSMQSVLFYICLLLRHSTEGDKLVPLFTKTWPRLSILQHIHQGTRRLLWKSSS